MQNWPLQAAKAHLSEPMKAELVKPEPQQPQQLSSHGEPGAVGLAAGADHRQQHKGESLVAFIRRSPLVEADGLKLERSPAHTRNPER